MISQSLIHLCIHIGVIELWSHVHFDATAGTMRLALSLPRVEAVDLRPWVPPEHALVVSSEHTNPDGSYRAAQQAKNVAWPPPSNSPAHLMKPSFLTVELCAQQSLSRQKVTAYRLSVTKKVSPNVPMYLFCYVTSAATRKRTGVMHVLHIGDKLQTGIARCLVQIQMRLQRPTVVAEVGFMLSVAKFFIPGFAMSGLVPIPFESNDVVLTGELLHTNGIIAVCCSVPGH